MSQGLVLDKLTISRGGKTLLAVDHAITPGQVLTVMGPSGSGKSTLINAIAGFLPKAFECQGKILLNDQEITQVPPERRHVGVLFQDPLLFPHFSVIGNVQYALPPEIKGHARKAEALKLLRDVGLEECAERDPATLSGGQQARVALVRVLAAAPSALLLDEPFSKLDQALRGTVRDLVFGEITRRQLPALLVTHDPEDAKAAGGQELHL